MTAATAFTILLGLCCLLTSMSAQSPCGSIGSTDETELDRRTDRRFFLEVNNPATCAGSITSWRVCYYGPNSIASLGSYWATYAVYRRTGSDSFERMSGIYKAIRTIPDFTGMDRVDGEIQQGGFNCYDDLVRLEAGDSPFIIQVGDIIGACVFNPDDQDGVERLQLDVVGDAGGGSEISFLEMNSDGCTMDALPSSVDMADLSNRNNRRVHIHANIATNMDTENALGNNSTPMSETPESESPPSPSSTGPGGFSAEAIIGIIVGILISLVLAVAVVVVVVCLAKRRQTAKSYSTGKDVPLQGLDNLSYGVGVERKVAKRVNGGRDEPTLYEVPVNSTVQSVNINGYTASDSEYELNYALSNVYEYATLGPNKMETTPEVYYSPLDEAKISYSKLLEQNKQEDIYGNVEEYLAPATRENELYAQIKAYGIRNISSQFIQINGHLGSGQFGLVEMGLWKDGAKSVQVALKLLKEESSEEDKVKFLQEAAIMAQFRHPNVVTLYGVVSSNKPLMLVVELIEKGDLRNYLHTMRPDPGELPAATLPQLLLSFSQQVALGMQYLSSKGFVHRDLAARNILVSKGNICKVADFGMSRDLADKTYYVSHGGMIPVKWTAPEAIHYKKYSTASDVWSYGCLLYEIWSFGYKPFEHIQNIEVIRILDSNKRLAPPPGCSRVIYELMIKCWNPVAANRPGFRKILLPLLGSPDRVLSIPQQDLDTHHLAGVLGSPLEAGENMYRDLRDRYLETDNVYQEMN